MRLQTDDGKTYHTNYGEDESPLVPLVRGVSAFTGSPPIAMEPLYYKIDLELLERMLEHADRTNTLVEISFTVDAVPVTIRSDRTIFFVDPYERMRPKETNEGHSGSLKRYFRQIF